MPAAMHRICSCLLTPLHTSAAFSYLEEYKSPALKGGCRREGSISYRLAILVNSPGIRVITAASDDTGHDEAQDHAGWCRHGDA